MSIENLSGSIYAHLAKLSSSNALNLEMPLSQLSQEQFNNFPDKCLTAFIGSSIGVYSGFMGLKTYLIAAAVEASIITGARLIDLNALADVLIPMLYTTLFFGGLAYYLAGRTIDENRD